MLEGKKIRDQITIKKMYSLFEASRDGSYIFGGEFHDFWECVYVEKGSISVSADDRVYNLNSGGIIFHKPMELHKYRVTSEKGAKIFIFSFTMEGPLSSFFCDKVFSLTENQKGIIRMLLDYMNEHRTTTNDNKGNEKNFMLTFEKVPTYAQMVASYIQTLMLSFVEGSTEIIATLSQKSMIFSEAVRYMLDNVESNLSVYEIAKHSNISVSGIKRVFEKYAGMSVHKYFLILKLNSATDLLEEGYSVGEVALKLGFCSQAYFSKAYKREFGISPSFVK